MDKLFKRKSSNKSIESIQNDTRVPEIALQSTETTAEKPALSRSSSTQSIIITPGKEEKAPVFDIQQEENLPSFQIEQEKEDVKEETDESNTNTLVEAAMDQAEAQDRHVRFQEHVAESAALVEHMLRMRTGQPVPAPDPLQTMVHNLQTYREEDDDELPQSPLTSSSGGIGSGGGSILASLMKLEAQRYGSEQSRKKKKKKSKARKKKTYSTCFILLLTPYSFFFSLKITLIQKRNLLLYTISLFIQVQTHYQMITIIYNPPQN